MNTKFLTATAALALLAAPALAQDKLKIGMTFQELNNPYFVSMQEALNEAAASLGAEVVVTDAGHDVAKQISDVEDMLQQNIDILLLNPTDSAGIEAAVHAAKAAGVIVVAVDANANGPVDTFVGSKNRAAGYLSCKYLGDALGGKGEVAILDGIPVVPILQRVEGCKAALAEFPDIQLVDTQNLAHDALQFRKKRVCPIGAVAFLSAALRRHVFQKARVTQAIQLHPHGVGGLPELVGQSPQVGRDVGVQKKFHEQLYARF